MAPREAEFTEIVQRLLQQQDEILSEKRKSKIQLIWAIGLPLMGILFTATGFYFNTQSRQNNTDKEIAEFKATVIREISELKSSVASMSALDRARMQQEIDKLQREAEHLKHP